MIVLGIDSASSAGYAIVDGERLIAHGVVDARDPARVWQLVGHLVVAHAPGLAVIEQAYVGRGEHANPATTMLLSRLIGRWEMALAARGVRSELVGAHEWQSAVLAGLLPPRPKRDDRKRAAAAWARATYGQKIVGDAADACGIASFVSRRESMAARLRRAG